MQQIHSRLHLSVLSSVGAIASLITLLFLSTACRLDIPPDPSMEAAPQSTQTVTNTHPSPIGTPPSLIKPEIYLSDPDVAMDYPALRVITEEISLRDFAESWNSSGIEDISGVGADPTEIKLKWLQAYNPMITTTLYSNDNVILQQIKGTPIMAEQLLSYINDPAADSPELSHEDYTYTLLFLNPVANDCFEASTGLTLSSIKEFNPNLPALEDNNIPAGTILFVPRDHVRSTDSSMLAPTSCRRGGETP